MPCHGGSIRGKIPRTPGQRAATHFVRGCPGPSPTKCQSRRGACADVKLGPGCLQRPGRLGKQAGKPIECRLHLRSIIIEGLYLAASATVFSLSLSLSCQATPEFSRSGGLHLALLRFSKSLVSNAQRKPAENASDPRPCQSAIGFRIPKTCDEPKESCVY